jgi:hypothetical protein
MEMLLLTGLCIITAAIIQRQNASMRSALRARVEKTDRRSH